MNLSPVVALLACTEIQLHTYKAENLLNSLEQVTNDRLDVGCTLGCAELVHKS